MQFMCKKKFEIIDAFSGKNYLSQQETTVIVATAAKEDAGSIFQLFQRCVGGDTSYHEDDRRRRQCTPQPLMTSNV